MPRDPQKFLLSAYCNEYQDPANNLHGCDGDAIAWSNLAKNLGYTTLILGNSEAASAPFCAAMRALVAAAQPGDAIRVVWSGHGAKLQSGLATICCYDFDWYDPKTWITAQDLAAIFGDAATKGVDILLIFDSCYSGGIRAMYPSRRRRSLVHPDGHPVGILRTLPSLLPSTVRCWEATSADQEAEETSFRGHVRGAFSWYAIDALNAAASATQGPNLNRLSPLSDVNSTVLASLTAAGFAQTPQVVASTERSALPWDV